MLAFIGGIALAAAAAAQWSLPPADPCAGDPSCRQASAAELFSAADALAAEGDLEGAEGLLDALTQDPDPDLRAEARFRLAAVRENRGNLAGAVAALRDLLAEKPDAQRARLELSRLLALQGDDRAARHELRQVSARGLPPDVALTVRRFSSALASLKRRGLALDIAIGADSNVNRATSDRFVDTVIAPFELDADARAQAGIGVTLGAEAWSRDKLVGTMLLTRAGARADLFAGKSRFNDLQLSLSSGPEFTTGIGRFRPAVLYERRWYGDDAYSKGYGASLNWLVPNGKQGQLQLDASLVRQTILQNALQSGHRYAAALSYDHGFTESTVLRLTLRGAAIDARIKPESLRQGGADLLLIHNVGKATLFAQAGYSRIEALAPIALFGRTRSDDRVDLGAGAIASGARIAGFAPLLRITYTDSRSTLGLYDYRRARLDIGLTREF